MGLLIDMRDLSFWLLLAVAPGTVMLVALGIHYRGIPRINAKPSTPIDPLAEIGPDELGRRDSAIATEHFDKPVDTREKTGSRPHLPVPDSAIGATHNLIRDKDLTELAAEMRKLAGLTSRLADKRQTLRHTATGPLLATDNTTPNRHYLSFALGGEPFAVSMLSVYAIVDASQLITKSGMPPKFRRAIRLRNALVPVIDLGSHLGGQPIKIGWSTSIVILEVSNGDRMQMIGVVVDAVGKLLEIPAAEIDPPVTCDSKIRNDFTFGTVMINNHRVTLLDIERGVSVNEFIVLRSAPQSVAQENIST
jgi:chemotaxis signal transduction protein